MRKIIIVLIMMGLLIGSVNAWTIVDKENRVSGTIDFYKDGTGVVNITGGPELKFSWYQNGDMIRANYLFYGVNIYYNVEKDELYSPDVGNVTLKR